MGRCVGIMRAEMRHWQNVVAGIAVERKPQIAPSLSPPSLPALAATALSLAARLPRLRVTRHFCESGVGSTLPEASIE